MNSSNGRISGTGLNSKTLQNNQANLLSTSNYNINSMTTDDNVSNAMSNAYMGASIHRLNKTKQ